MRQGRAQKPDVEQLAIEARDNRLRECAEAVQKTLTQYDARLFTALGVGQQTIEIKEIAGLPILIQLVSTK